jgi:hypothetical protein
MKCGIVQEQFNYGGHLLNGNENAGNSVAGYRLLCSEKASTPRIPLGRYINQAPSLSKCFTTLNNLKFIELFSKVVMSQFFLQSERDFFAN